VSYKRNKRHWRRNQQLTLKAGGIYDEKSVNIVEQQLRPSRSAVVPDVSETVALVKWTVVCHTSAFIHK